MKIQYRLICIIIIVSMLTTNVNAWTNGVGSPSIDPKNPKIGTHDYIINSAINMLPANLRNKIDIVAADYGSEMPDYNSTMCQCIYGLRDQRYHEISYWANGVIQKDGAARRAQEEYDTAMSNLTVGDKYNFSIHIGMMSHYISDVADFPHTMGNGTQWGITGPGVHGDYENFVYKNYKIFSNTSIKFDGKYDNIAAYDAALNAANDTTFDNKFGKGIYTNTWMNSIVSNSPNISYATADKIFINRTGQSLNYNVNLLADVIYSMVSPKKDILAYYRGLGQFPNKTETSDLLKAADDWRNNIIPKGFSVPITTSELLTLADEWRNS